MKLALVEVFLVSPHVLLFLFSLLEVARKEIVSSSKHARQIIKEAEAEQRLLSIAQAAIEKDARLRALYEKLKNSPRDGTQVRNLRRSEILLSIDRITKNSKMTLAIKKLAQVNCKSQQARIMILPKDRGGF